MGSIFSKPKMPSMPALPALTATPTVTTTPTTTAEGEPPVGTGGNDSPVEPTPDEQRVKNILTRSRGRIGTIATSLNGILSSDIANLPARKTLLGE